MSIIARLLMSVPLGVREHVELQLVFSRLNDLNWDTPKLVCIVELRSSMPLTVTILIQIRYLCSVRDKFTEKEWQRLRDTELLMTEGDPIKRQKASDVFKPKPILRELGLPILEWKGDLKKKTPEVTS